VASSMRAVLRSRFMRCAVHTAHVAVSTPPGKVLR
jgi:hypothetical protein